MQRFKAKSSVILTSSFFGFLCTGALCAFSSLHADSPASQSHSEPPSYDGDLFNKNKSVFFVNAEFLYWLVNEGAVDYAVKMNHPARSTTGGTFAIGNYRNAEFDWAPGFRINFGHFNAPHFWDVLAQYTYVPASGTRRAHAPKAAGEYLNGTWAQPSVGSGSPLPSLSEARAHIDLQYNAFDFLFTRRFHTNEHLRFNVFAGLASALIFQKLKVSYEDVIGQSAHINNRWRFEGLGIRLGLKIDWYMGYDIYMTGLASTGILSGWYKNSGYEKTDAIIPDADSSIPVFDVHFSDFRLTYTAQFAAGPSWQKRFDHNRIEIFAGYEFNVWTNLHQIYRSEFASPTAAKQTFINNSNVSLQGLTVRLNVDF